MEKLDWRRPEDYDRLNNAAPHQWAWEFLRRNALYREEYERYVDASIEEMKKPGSSNADELCGAEKWTIGNGYHDPENDNPGIEWLPLKGGTEALQFGMADFDTGIVYLQFNFRQPLVHQVERARKTLQQLQEEAKEKGFGISESYKPRERDFITLLRVLDAEASGARNVDIGKLLFPPTKATFDPNYSSTKAYNKRIEAQTLRDRDYRLINIWVGLCRLPLTYFI